MLVCKIQYKTVENQQLPLDQLADHHVRFWKLFSWLALFCVLNLGAAVQAKPATIQLQEEPDYYQRVINHLEYFIDQDIELDVADIQNNPTRFTPVTSKYADFGLTNGRIWMRFSVQNSNDKRGTWRLDLKRQYFKELDLFLVRNGQPAKLVLRHNENTAFSERIIPSRFLEFDFEMQPGETVQFLASYRSTSTTYLPIAVAKPDGVFLVHSREERIDWVLNGALIAMVIFALLLTPVTGWKLSISFSLYVSAGLFYIANADGYNFQYLWPNHPWLNDPMNLTAMLLMPATGLLFARQLFDFKTLKPAFDKLLLAIIILFFILAVLAIPLTGFQWYMVPAYSMIPMAKLVQVSAGVIALKGKRVGAIPYLVGAMLIVSSIAYATTAHLLPGRIDLDSTLDFGHFILFSDCLAFAIAMMLRMLALRKDRDLALQAELRVSEEKLALSETLVKTQQEYHDARDLSEKRRNQLSSVSHDIRQPLVSLRNALGRIRGKNEQVTEQMNAAFDYLETLAVGQLAADELEDNELLTPQASEMFPVRVVLDNVREIFADEAKSKDVEFRYRPIGANVRTDPVALMRAVSNLVSNAVKHTDDGALLLGARLRRDHVRIEIWDTGAGLNEQEIKQRMTKHNKGEGSFGTGLGFTIVKEICETHGLTFAFHSRKGAGSVAFIHVPVSK